MSSQTQLQRPFFVMEGVEVENEQTATNLLTSNQPDGRKVKSTHVCDINILGLPTTLTGNSVPNLAMTLLFGIQVLCKAGCKVVFDNGKCDVYFDKNIILQGYNDGKSCKTPHLAKLAFILAQQVSVSFIFTHQRNFWAFFSQVWQKYILLCFKCMLYIIIPRKGVLYFIMLLHAVFVFWF